MSHCSCGGCGCAAELEVSGPEPILVITASPLTSEQAIKVSGAIQAQLAAQGKDHAVVVVPDEVLDVSVVYA